MENFNAKILLKRALSILTENNVHETQWDIGGGTVLSAIYNHRISKDIDIFIKDIQLINSLSPRLNEPDNLLDYNESSNYISLTFPEGKVDFIHGSQLTKFSSKKQLFLGEIIPIEDPVEIVLKKMYYRAYKLYPRDMFDLAVVFNSKKKCDLINETLPLIDKFNIFSKAVEEKETNLRYVPYSENNGYLLLPNGIFLAGKELSICKEYIHSVNTLINIKNSKYYNNENQKILYSIGNKILTQNNNRLPENFNLKVIEILENKYSKRKILEIMKFSPLKEDITKILKNISKNINR